MPLSGRVFYQFKTQFQSSKRRARRPAGGGATGVRAVGSTAVVDQCRCASDGAWQFDFTSDGTNPASAGVTGGFVTGPATPPLGIGMAHLTTGTGNGDQASEIRNLDYQGLKLSALTSLGYSEFTTSNNGQQTPYLSLDINLDGNLTDTDPSKSTASTLNRPTRLRPAATPACPTRRIAAQHLADMERSGRWMVVP